jgi:large subunit ribosomal protein L24e
MVAKRQCSFCAQEIEPGTGTMFVKRDGTVYQFCSSSCRKQQLHLGRIGHRFKWTRAYALKRSAERSSAGRAGATPGARAPRAPTPAAEPEPKAAAPAGAPIEAAPAAAPAKKPRAKRPAKSPAPPPAAPSSDA